MFLLTKGILAKPMRESQLRVIHIFVSSEEFEAVYLSDIFVRSACHHYKVGHVTIFSKTENGGKWR